MQSGVSLCIMDISGQSSGTDHIRTRSAEVCQLLQTSISRPIKLCFLNTCICSLRPKDTVEKLLLLAEIALWSWQFANAAAVLCAKGTIATHGNSFHPSEQSTHFLPFSFRGEGKVASYVTKCHFSAVRRLMYEDRNGQCWTSRPHTHTHRYTQTQDWWMTQVLGPESRLIAW